MNESAGRQIASPQQWVFALFILFGGAQVVAGAVFFFAYNWRDLPDLAKIALPQAAMVLAFLIWAGLRRDSRLGAVAGIVATVMIGVSMGVVGQVYQLGADPWRLFAIWAALAFPIAVITRSDPQFAFALAVVSIAYFLYTDENFQFSLPRALSAIFAVYALIIFGMLLARESVAGGAPPWLRWLLAATALGAGVIGGLVDIVEDRLFLDGSVASSVALFAVGGGLFAAYRYWRPDRPAQSMALFAIAIFAGAIGPRLIFMAGIEGASDLAFALFFSAAWIVGVTAALAAALRRLAGKAGA